MDVSAIIGSIVTIIILGYSIYSQYKANMAQHKTTQGKIGSVISTTATQETAIQKLATDIEDLKSQITGK